MHGSDQILPDQTFFKEGSIRISYAHGLTGRIREYPKAWGNCVLMVMLAGIMDAFCTQNLPVENPPFGHQPDDLAARVGFFVDHLA
jgi:hypothetical protein